MNYKIKDVENYYEAFLFSEVTDKVSVTVI